MKKIEDYLHLYMGCDCKVEEFDGAFKLTGISYDDQQGVTWAYFENTELGYAPIDKVKPLLRNLSSMTEEEAIEATKPVIAYGYQPDLQYNTYRNTFNELVVSWGNTHREKYVPEEETCFKPEQFRYLLSKGFDLFGLLDAGLAVAQVSDTTAAASSNTDH